MKSRYLVFGTLAILVSLVAVSLAYAGFTQTLNINGTGTVTSTSWSVHFENLTNVVKSGTAKEDTAPTIKTGKTEIGDYAVSFYTPGDSVTYTFDVVNDGDYDAKIALFTKNTPTCSGTDTTSNTNVCNNLEYTLKYTSNNQDVKVNDELKVGETKNMTLVLRYKNTIGQNQLPTSEVTVGNLGISMQYSQDSLAGGNGSSAQTPSYVYSISTTGQSIGNTLTVNNTDVFDNYNDAITKFGQPFFTAHVVNSNNEITESYVGFVKDGTAYYLKGGDSGLAYNSNKQVLDTAFGSSNCTLGNEGTNNEYYSCSASGLDANAYVYGYVRAFDGDSNCDVGGGGYSGCYVGGIK